MSSYDEETDASEKAHTQRQNDTSDAVAVSLFGNEIDEREDVVLDDVESEESDSTSLLSEISCSLSFLEH